MHKLQKRVSNILWGKAKNRKKKTNSSIIIISKSKRNIPIKKKNRNFTFKAGASPRIILQNTQQLSPFFISFSPQSPEAQVETKSELNDVVLEVSASGLTWEESRAKRRRARASIVKQPRKQWNVGYERVCAMDFCVEKLLTKQWKKFWEFFECLFLVSDNIADNCLFLFFVLLLIIFFLFFYLFFVWLELKVALYCRGK